MNKEYFRKKVSEMRVRIKEDAALRHFKERESTLIEKYLTSPCFVDAKRVFLYYSTELEIDTTPIVQKAFSDHKAVFLPKVLSKKVEGGRMEFVQVWPDSAYRRLQGIMEPESDIYVDPDRFHEPSELLIPGLCFDLKGNRIGYGGGYYDRYLERFPSSLFHITAAAFDFQVFDALPVDPHDIAIDLLLTESREFFF